ncbi:glycosyltransferase family 4 protein [Gracilibacillus caseinilyticus]|uniref:Glycosyltransferase family 4 protein n=1 Tax=Gracilibacillus caseinilyticus TaxID=2932256 RepID=A0ABY4F1B2_9BACI|nr:glycosyltransferase family 4 protein [Gracilibacillus caseinilyticus]UOQ50325.1 glycosyltransferase family 4 protein [Gracilibacillus caseinilyticus]
MKICYLADINNYHTKKWVEYFSSIGHEIIVISLANGQIKNCKSYCFGFSNVKHTSLFKKVKYLTYIKKIKEILKKEKPDLLHAHYASSYGLLSVLSGYKPSIVSLWGSDILLFPKKTFIHKFIITRVLNGDNFLFSTSDYMISESKQYLKKNKQIHLTPFGVNTNKFKPVENKDKKNETFIIGVNKSLETISGIDVLLKAFNQFMKKNDRPQVELRIAGKGSKKGYFLDLCKELSIEKYVKFYGYLNEDEVVKFLQDLDLAVYPSRSESFGVSAVEAQACGIPVIASDVDGFKESTMPGETALLFESENELELCHKIQILYRNQAKRKSMSQKAIGFVIDKFNLRNNFNEVEIKYIEISNS